MSLGEPRGRSVGPRRAVRAALCAGWLLLASTSAALAQPPTPDADLSAQATQLYNEGAKAAKTGQWDKARTFYLSAWRVQKHWQIAVSLGRAEFKVDKFRDAAEHLTYYLRTVPNAEPEVRAQIEALLKESKAKVGTVVVTVDPAGATVLVDGAEVGAAPLLDPVFMEGGQRAIGAQKDGYAPATVTREVLVGGEVKLELRLEKLPEKKGVTVLPPPPPPPPPPAGPNKAIVIGGAAATGVLTVVGVGLAAGSTAKVTCRQTKALPPATRQDCENARAAFANGSFYTLITAGAVGVGTLVYFLVARRASPPKSVPPATAFVGPGTGGVLVTGRW